MDFKLAPSVRTQVVNNDLNVLKQELKGVCNSVHSRSQELGDHV